jgi:serine/threonine protein kinase
MSESNVADSANNPQGDSPPEIIANRFRIDGILGRGGMGTVYRATHLSLDRTVALKLINPEYAANKDIAHRFAREARLMAKLRHPHAATIFDAGDLPDGRSFIVMEYVEGASLAQILTDGVRLPAKRAVEIASGICDVLSEAHSLGIVHRDLKPANIMLNERGVFVLDFGVAKMLQSEDSTSLKHSMTAIGSLIGTPHYMSPEQCAEQPVEARSDLYSLGIVLYEMLGGRLPFTAPSLSAILIQQATAEPMPLNNLREDLPPALVATVHQLLAKNPEERPATAAAVRAMLEASLTEPALPKTSSHTTKPTILMDTAPELQNPATPVPPASRSKRWNILGVAAALLLVAALSVGITMWLGSRSNTSKATNASPNKAASNTSTANHNQHDMATEKDYAINSNDEAKNTEANSTRIAPLLTQDEADAVILKITQNTHHRADGMQIVKTPKDTAIVCLHNMWDEGKTHAFAVERPNLNSPWDISARVSLDVPEFRSANWKFEPLDADQDGFEEVMFSGTDADNTARRYLIYVPRTRQSYSLLIANAAPDQPSRSTLSPNASAPAAAPYRTALEQAAR